MIISKNAGQDIREEDVTGSAVRLAMPQTVARYPCNRFTEADGERLPLFAGMCGNGGSGVISRFRTGVPGISPREAVRKARAGQEEFRGRQRQGV